MSKNVMVVLIYHRHKYLDHIFSILLLELLQETRSADSEGYNIQLLNFWTVPRPVF
jgi:hypothetical protein